MGTYVRMPGGGAEGMARRRAVRVTGPDEADEADEAARRARRMRRGGMRGARQAPEQAAWDEPPGPARGELQDEAARDESPPATIRRASRARPPGPRAPPRPPVPAPGSPPPGPPRALSG